jgi:hypothetical protein
VVSFKGELGNIKKVLNIQTLRYKSPQRRPSGCNIKIRYLEALHMGLAK